MTESEAKGFVQGKLDCMEKCDVFNKEDKHRNNECDNCHYCYSQGNFGEQKEAFSVAINALEKQMPKKPIMKQYFDDMEEEYLCCPTCGEILTDRMPMDNKDFYFHCLNCGQKLNWESDEE